VQLARLTAYKLVHGEALGLGKWVSHQRQGKRQLDRVEPSQGMTAARAAWLTAVGFTWVIGQVTTAPLVETALPRAVGTLVGE
jgi:hypothetical protein